MNNLVGMARIYQGDICTLSNDGFPLDVVRIGIFWNRCIDDVKIYRYNVNVKY